MKSAANVVVLILMAVSAILVAQNPPASPPTPAASSETPAEAAKTPEPAITAELERLQQFASQATQAIAGLHIESWKTNSTARSAAQANADSIHRNLTAALPGLIEAAKATPDDVNAEFKLYRNVIALYEAFGALTDSSRLVGQKGQYEAMSAQLQMLATVRRNLGEDLEASTAATQAQLKQMRQQIKGQEQQLAAAKADAADARQQVVLAQAELAKKAAPKKKPPAKKPAATANGTTPNTTSSNGSGQAQPASSTPKP